jgi:hypothetical protein
VTVGLGVLRCLLGASNEPHKSRSCTSNQQVSGQPTTREQARGKSVRHRKIQHLLAFPPLTGAHLHVAQQESVRAIVENMRIGSGARYG